MRTIFFLLVIIFISRPVICQQPSKKEMQAQMLEAINELNKQIVELEKQITDAKKNKEDEETIKDLEDQLEMLKKQVAMMGGVKKSLSGISEKTFQQAAEEGTIIVPKKDVIRINSLPKQILSDAELASFVKYVFTEVEKMLPAGEKSEGLKIYNETKAKYKSPSAVSSAAIGCWMFGHWEKSLYLMGRACLDDIADPDNLNNYAAFLISTGGEQAALPILEYLNKKFPDNSTILNNIGQAWFGLGDSAFTRKNLVAALALYPNHSQANLTLSEVYLARQDSTRAIEAIKRSISETYDPEKESKLAQIGYILDYDDLPDFDYPIDADDSDPLGFMAYFDALPAKPRNVDEVADAENIITAFKGMLRNASEKTKADKAAEDKKHTVLSEKMAKNPVLSKKILERHNSSPYKLAHRKLQLNNVKKEKKQKPIKLDMLSPRDIFDSCAKRYEIEVLIPTQALLDIAKNKLKEIERRYDECVAAGSNSGDCRNIACQEINNERNYFLAEDRLLYEHGKNIFRQIFNKYRKELIEDLKVNYYAELNVQYTFDEQMTNAIFEKVIERKKAFFEKYNEGLTSFTYHYNKLSVAFGKCKTKNDILNESDELAPLVPAVPAYKEPKCVFEKNIDAGVVRINSLCNEIEKKSDKIGDRPSGVNKGAGHSSSRNNPPRANGPINPRIRGPFNSTSFDDEPGNNELNRGPLNAEVKDLSQFSIEFDQWGNITGMKFQLNKEGTALADPDSVESGVDSRWSWNAIASAKKGFLNKLLIK